MKFIEKINTKTRAVGLIGLLVVLLVVAGLVAFNWERFKEMGDSTEQKMEEGQNQIEHFKEEVKEIEDKMKDRLDDL